jgi:hypothetical protein
MALFANGEIPFRRLVEIGRGTDRNGDWQWLLTPATVARFRLAQSYSFEHFGREIGIRDGWNGYRPLAAQQEARRDACDAGNCAGAAVPGFSSHGGNWNDRDCLAIDVDPNGLGWDQVWEACSAAGFEVGLITQSISGIPGGEPWHIIDFNAFGAVPSGFEDGEFEMNTEQNRMLENIYAAIFNGGRSMDDGGKSIAESLATISANVAPIQRVVNGKVVALSIRQEIADSKTGILELLGRPVAGVDADDAQAIATALAPLLSAHLGELTDADLSRLADAAADERDRRGLGRRG